MCIIAAQMTNAAPLADDILSRCWDDNPDGAGFMYCREGELVIRKPFFRFADFREAYLTEQREWAQSSPFILHFRWATHGSLNATNTHPHTIIPRKVGMVHNGVIRIDVPKGLDVSDTVWYAARQLCGKSQERLMGKRMRRRIESQIGKGNKIVLLDNVGNVSICNEGQGIWEGDTWYSNDGYLPKWYELDEYALSDDYGLFDSPGDELDELARETFDCGWEELTDEDRQYLLWEERFGRRAPLFSYADRLSHSEELAEMDRRFVDVTR
jgi:hypothetical protein